MYGNEVECAKGQVLGTVSRPSLTERLAIQRDHLKEQLAKVEAALDAMEKNPEVAATVDAISRLGGII